MSGCLGLQVYQCLPWFYLSVSNPCRIARLRYFPQAPRRSSRFTVFARPQHSEPAATFATVQRVPYESLPQEPLHDNVFQECLTRVSRRSVSQECLTKVSNQFFARRCLARVPHQSASPECPTRVPLDSHEDFSRDCTGVAKLWDCFFT